MKRKRRGNGERMRKWRENEGVERVSLTVENNEFSSGNFILYFIRD